MGEVVRLEVKPKTFQRTYKKHKITVTFIPATKKWRWKVTVVTTTHYDDYADTSMKAVRAAEKFIDKIEKAKGGT